MLLDIFVIITFNYIWEITWLHFISSSGASSCSFIWAYFFVFPFWLSLCVWFFVLGKLAKTLVQAYVSHCLWLSVGNVFGAIMIHRFSVLGWVLGERTKLCTKASFYLQWSQSVSEKVSKHPESASACRLPVSPCHRKSLQLSISAGLKFHTVGQEGFLRLRLLFPLSWCHLERSALPQKDSFCSVGGWLSTVIRQLTLQLSLQILLMLLYFALPSLHWSPQ